MLNLSLGAAHYEVSLSVKLFFFRTNLKGLSYPQVNNNNYNNNFITYRLNMGWTFTNLHQTLNQDFT